LQDWFNDAAPVVLVLVLMEAFLQYWDAILALWQPPVCFLTY
jgi:hypothetical protein